MSREEPRILYIGAGSFLERPTGAGLRYRLVRAGLERAGDVTVFSYHRDRSALAKAASVLTRSPLAALTPRVPLLRQAPYASARREFAAVAERGWDVVWFAHPMDVLQLGSAESCPSVVDFPRIESLAIDRELDGKRGLTARSLRRRRDDWAHLERRVLSRVTIATVCHELDRQCLGSPNLRILPMGYPLPDQPAGRLRVGRPPSLLLAGSLHLDQNADAAMHLASTLLPRIRREIPDATARIVGAAPPRIARDLERFPGVSLTGFVARLETELARADVVAAPLRHGGGTHVKILEAFAHRVPVVTSAIGIEGIDATSGVHAIVADDDDQFARACVRLLRDESLRARLVQSAHVLVEERYGTEVTEARTAAIAREMMGSMTLQRDRERTADG